MSSLTYEPDKDLGRYDLPRDQLFNIIDKQGVAVGPFVPFPGPKRRGRCEPSGTWWPMEPHEKWILRINGSIHVCSNLLGRGCDDSKDPLTQVSRHLSWSLLRRRRGRLLRSRNEKDLKKWLDELLEWRAAYYRSFPDDRPRWDLRSCCQRVS